MNALAALGNGELDVRGASRANSQGRRDHLHGVQALVDPVQLVHTQVSAVGACILDVPMEQALIPGVLDKKTVRAVQMPKTIC